MNKTIASIFVVLMLTTLTAMAYSDNIPRIVRLQTPIGYDGDYSGYIRYQEQGTKLKIFVSTSYLDTSKTYQLCLEGVGDVKLVNACPNPNQGFPWVCGWWNDLTFYNFHIGKLGSVRDTVYVQHDYFEVALPKGEYKNIKFIVKDNSSPWAHPLEGTNLMNFNIR